MEFLSFVVGAIVGAASLLLALAVAVGVKLRRLGRALPVLDGLRLLPKRPGAGVETDGDGNIAVPREEP